MDIMSTMDEHKDYASFIEIQIEFGLQQFQGRVKSKARHSKEFHGMLEHISSLEQVSQSQQM